MKTLNLAPGTLLHQAALKERHQIGVNGSPLKFKYVTKTQYFASKTQYFIAVNWKEEA